MNITEAIVKLDRWDSTVRTAKVQLEEALKIDKQRKELLSLVNESDGLVSYLSSLHTSLRTLQQIVRKEEVAFKKRRLGYLDGSITERLEYIFPKKKLRARTECNFERKNTKLRLSLVDYKGNVRPPHLTEGKFAQQLISYTGAESCVKLLGKNILYLDESFSNASEDNLIKTQELLKKSAAGGFQIILISQSPLLFVDLERREIHLHSNDGEFVDKVEYNDFLGGGSE